MPLLVHTSHVLLLGTIESRTHMHTMPFHSHVANPHMQELPNVVRLVRAQEVLLA